LNQDLIKIAHKKETEMEKHWKQIYTGSYDNRSYI